jgi:hypothetical protein
MTRIWLVSVAALGLLACSSEAPELTEVSAPTLAALPTS